MLLTFEATASSVSILIGSAVLLACFVACCAAVCVIDIRSRRIPNSILLVLLTAAGVQMFLSAVLDLPVLTVLGPPVERIVWAAVLFLIGFAAELIWRRTHQGAHGMGFGDIKLAAVGALWVGSLILLALLCACGVAAVVAIVRRQKTFAFGPYLSAALFLSLCIRLFGS